MPKDNLHPSPTELVTSWYKLSPQTQDIMQALDEGLTYKQAALRLGYSYRTIVDHVHIAKKAFNAISRSHLYTLVNQSLDLAGRKDRRHEKDY